MQRQLVPELLDSLPSDHPDAIHSRRDLRIVNRLMGNSRWFQRTLPACVRPGERTLELGAGAGDLALLLQCANPAIDALDRVAAPAAWPAHARWHQADLQHFDSWPDYPVVIGNLILHHFEATELRALGKTLQAHARVLIFCEPARRRRFLWIWNVLAPLCLANHVTRHDGRASITAGFRGNELPRALGLSPLVWTWRIESSVLGAYRLVAERRDSKKS